MFLSDQDSSILKVIHFHSNIVWILQYFAALASPVIEKVMEKLYWSQVNTDKILKSYLFTSTIKKYPSRSYDLGVFTPKTILVHFWAVPGLTHGSCEPDRFQLNLQIGQTKTTPLLNKYYWNEGTLNRDKIP